MIKKLSYFVLSGALFLGECSGGQGNFDYFKETERLPTIEEVRGGGC